MSTSSTPKNPEFDDTMEYCGSCPECHYVLPRLVECAPTYFKDGQIVCVSCRKSVDLWKAVLSKATADLPTSWSLHWLGAARTSVVIPMETGKYYEVQLTNHGAPPDAKILTVDCAPQGGEGGYLTALEWHPNSSGRSVGTVVRLIAVCLTEEPVASTRRVLVSVVWIRGEESDAWPYLVTAFGAAAAQEFAPSMVFAQSAVEISMMPLIEQRLRRHVAANRVENFMKDSLTYSHALNVVLPYLIAELGGPKLPEPIRGQLNSLRKKRNAIIHQGVKAAAVSREDAMKGLCAAAFGFEYMRHVGPILSESHR